MFSCIKVVSDGIAYGKVCFVMAKDESSLNTQNEQIQLEQFNNAIESVTKEIEQQIHDSKIEFNQRISDIFETHKYIVNDPMILDRTHELIKEGLKPASAYIQAVSEILEQFKQIDNEYMLGRIVDILDATDRVKAKLKIFANDMNLNFDEPSILIIKELKPSIIYSIYNKNIKGFISETGYYHQHSSIIARTINIPGMICNNVFQNITQDDYLLIDCYLGEIYINPDVDFIRNKLGGRL